MTHSAESTELCYLKHGWPSPYHLYERIWSNSNMSIPTLSVSCIIKYFSILSKLQHAFQPVWPQHLKNSVLDNDANLPVAYILLWRSCPTPCRSQEAAQHRNSALDKQRNDDCGWEGPIRSTCTCWSGSAYERCPSQRAAEPPPLSVACPRRAQRWGVIHRNFKENSIDIFIIWWHRNWQ